MTEQITLTFNSSNVVSNNGYNNKLVIQNNLPIDLRGYEMALRQLTINYSFPSVTTTTCGFTYDWPSAVPVLGTAVTLQQYSTYSAADLNAYLQSVMYAAKHYLENTTTGEILYYLSIQANAVLYGIQFNSMPLPTVLPAGFTIPAGATWALPAATANPQFQVAASNQFTTLTGLAAGTYPAAPTPGVSYSTVTDDPHLSPYSSISIRSDQANAALSRPQNQLEIVAINSAYGQPIVFNAYTLAWVATTNQSTNTFTLTLLDQNGNDLRILDTYYQAVIVLRPRVFLG